MAVVGTKGQIVIPLDLRRELNIGPKSKLAIYRRGDKLVLTRLKIPSLDDELKTLFSEIDKQYRGRKKPSQSEILREIQSYRTEKRAR